MKQIKYFRPRPAGRHRLYVRGIGIEELMRPCIVDRPDGTGDHLFMYFYDTVLLKERSGTRDAVKDALIIWPPGMHQRYGNAQKQFLHTWVHASGPRLASLLSENSIPLGTAFPFKRPGMFVQYLRLMHQEITAHRKDDPLIMESLCTALIRDIARTLSFGTDAALPEHLLRARDYIEANYARTIRLADIAQRAGLSVSHFGIAYKQATGLSPIDHAVELRILEASALLANRNMRIAEIARHVGYDDIYHFSKIFKKRFGKSPRAYRDSQY